MATKELVANKLRTIVNLVWKLLKGCELHSLHQDAGHGKTAEHWLAEAICIDPQAVSVEATEPDEPSATVRGEDMGGTGFTLYGDSFQGRRW